VAALALDSRFSRHATLLAHQFGPVLTVATLQIGGVVMAFLFWRQTGAAAPNYRAFL
jgi:hypothetical protein